MSTACQSMHTEREHARAAPSELFELCCSSLSSTRRNRKFISKQQFCNQWRIRMGLASSPLPTSALYNFFSDGNYICRKYAIKKTNLNVFSTWLMHPTHCCRRNYGLAPDGGRITLRIHEYVADGLGDEVTPAGCRGRGAPD